MPEVRRQGGAEAAPQELQNLEVLQKEALEEIANAPDQTALQALRVRLLGKKGVLTAQLKGLGALSVEMRKAQGAAVNETKRILEAAFAARREALEREALERQLLSERLDVTLPGVAFPVGGLHLLTRLTHRLLDVFRSLGYDVAVGPELETDDYNFRMLNFPDEHPARDTQDTFWTEDGRLLRTHTSPVQVRYMLAHEPPFKVVAPGRVFRNEAVDVTHEAMFHQLEALVVGERVTMADMHGAILSMARALFGPEAKTRLQPTFFPFVEPGAEFAVWWTNPRTGRGEWLELGGCGMVHPNVFKAVGYENVTGFAFGFGLERLAMVSYGVPDVRYFFSGDLRVLRQFRGPL
jgi:phenylalanyl-tRNA synthetase alpha chain